MRTQLINVLTVILLLAGSSILNAQDRFTLMPASDGEGFNWVMEIEALDQDFQMITVRQHDTPYSRTFTTVSGDQSISSTFIPYQSFQPVNQEGGMFSYMVTTYDAQHELRDSFNPYGVRRVQDAIILGVVNTIFSRFIQNGRERKARQSR